MFSISGRKEPQVISRVIQASVDHVTNIALVAPPTATIGVGYPIYAVQGQRLLSAPRDAHRILRSRPISCLPSG